jgi:Leucine-rich repeat (LRR) protein
MRRKFDEAAIVQDDFSAGLQAWVDLATPQEREARDVAMQRILFAKQTNSQRLELDELGLSSLPAEIGNLTALTGLHLYNNQLTTLPTEIGNLTALTGLSLDGNQLTTLPTEIGNLTALIVLHLYNNQLTTLPTEIGNLTDLRNLNLDGNQLTTLPESLLNPPAGLHRNIRLESNPISPAEAIRLSQLALAGGVTLEISIQDHQAPAAAQQQELANSIGDKILLKAPEEKREELKALLDSEQLPNFKLFLAECTRTEGWKSHEPEMTQRLLEILEKMSESEAVKIKCETLAATASGSCGDRVGLAFVHMQLALNLSDKEVKDMSPQEVYDYAKQESVIKFLSDKSQAKIDQIKTFGGGLDEIETHLAYLQIGQELGLNLRGNGMLYQRCSNVTDKDLESAKEEFQASDPELLTAKHLYEDGMLRKHPFVQEIITEVSSREEFSAEEKEGENSQEYQARVNTLPKLVAEAAIAEIASRCNEFRSSAETGFASVGGGGTPNPTPNPTGGASAGGGLLERGL